MCTGITKHCAISTISLFIILQKLRENRIVGPFMAGGGYGVNSEMVSKDLIPIPEECNTLAYVIHFDCKKTT